MHSVPIPPGFVLAAGLWTITGVAIAAERLPIEHPAMDPRIHPIAPEDGAIAATNPPAMVFWHTSAAAKYTVEMCQGSDFGEPIVASGIELPLYNHHEILPLGRWYWRYCYETKDGARSEWSPVRSFGIAHRSSRFPVPPMSEILTMIPRHPRIYTTTDGLPAFRDRKDKEALRAFGHLLRVGDAALAAKPGAPELGRVCVRREGNSIAFGWGDPTAEEAAGAKQADLDALVASIRKKRGLAFWLEDGVGRSALHVRPSTLEAYANATRDLAMLYLITSERKYANCAKERLLWQANFRVDYHQPETAHHDTVHCYEYGLQRMASAYDCIYDVLSPAEREAVLHAVEFHGDACYRKLRFKRRIHLYWQNSHACQDMHELLTTALAVADDLPAATEWLEYLIPQYVNRIPWGKNDGGYSEGHYYNYKWHGILRGAVSLRNATGIDLFRKPRFSNAGRFWLYCMSLNYWWNHYGDNFALHNPLAGSGNDRDGASFLASLYQDRCVKWWADQIDGTLKMPLWYLSDETLKPKPPVDIPQSACYRDVGWAAMYDRFWDSQSTRLFFKCSPWGSYGHSHQDQNSFVIHSGGEVLAVDRGYYGYYGDRYHKEICRASKSHNTILVNGEGQGRGIQYNGHIVDFFDGQIGSFVSGDATAAYGGRLTKFIRAIVFIRPSTFVIYDQLEAPEPSTFSWQLNSMLKMRLDEPKQTVTIHSREVELRATHLMPGNLRYRQSNERAYPLKSRYNEAFPEQWTCWCETKWASKRLHFLTLFEACRAEGDPAIRDVRPVESEHLIGVSFGAGSDAYRVLFQRDMTSPAQGTCAGIETDAKCVVSRTPSDGDGQPRHFHASGKLVRIDGKAFVESSGVTSFDSSPRVRYDLPRQELFQMGMEDSKGAYEVGLEWAVNPWGEVFYFARLDPREQGVYEIAVDCADAEILVEDKWDPARRSQGHLAELREGSMLIIKPGTFLNPGSIKAKLKRPYRDRIVSLARNGNFEIGIPGYVPRGWWLRHFSKDDRSYAYWCTDDPAEGKACLKLFRDQHKIRAYSQSIKIAKPGRYVFRFKAKATCKGAVVNTSWSRQSIGIRVDPSDEWREYRAERDLTPHEACIHVIFDQADGPGQTLWVDDLEFGRLAE